MLGWFFALGLFFANVATAQEEAQRGDDRHDAVRSTGRTRFHVACGDSSKGQLDSAEGYAITR